MLALVGPTASGKTEAALAIAETLGAEIVSVDSMLVYRGMDVGTAKPSAAERARVPHHLIDLAEPSEPFSVARYQRAGRVALDQIARRGSRPMLVGGSGLYFRALVDQLEFPGTDPDTRADLELEAAAVGATGLHRRLAFADPAAAAKIEPGNVRRTVRALEVAAITGREFSSFAEAWERYPPGRVRAAGVELSRETLVARVEARVRAMLDRGFLEEVRELRARGLGRWLTSTRAIGYAEMAAHLDGRITVEDAVRETVSRTKSLARRQMAWFRRDPRIRWFEAGPAGAIERVDDILEHLEGGWS
ncbi:MAG TPA: tRNA (adenosine(37)-N6)-dimethylallyltransferase MiaA [Actinomycetota bacterium]|jgi:tRNA dimethylallyltransferase